MLVSIVVDYVANNLAKFAPSALQSLPTELRTIILDHMTKKNLLGKHDFGPLLHDETANPANEITSIDLSGYKEVSPSLIVNIAKSAPKLKRLIFNNCSTLDDQVLDKIVNGFHELEVLQLAGAFKLSELAFIKLGDAPLAKSLTELRINTARGIREETWIKVLTNCTALRSLSINCAGITDAVVESIIIHTQSLQELVDNELALTDKSLESLAKREQSLRRLRIGCKKITGENMGSVLAHHRQLLAIDLNGCEFTGPGAVIGLSRINSLEEVDIFDIGFVPTGYLLERIIKGCAGLRRLSSRMLTKPDGIDKMFKEENRIENLHLALVNERKKMKRITPARLTTIIQQSPNLQELQLHRVSPISLPTILGGLHSLASLSLSLYQSEEDLEELTNIKQTLERQSKIVCQELRTLKLEGIDATTFTAKALENILQQCNKVTSLQFPHSKKAVTDEFLMVVSKTLGDSLESLHLYGGGDSFSDAGLISIADRCSRLKYLDVRRCSKVSDAALDKLVSQCSRLRTIHLSGDCPVTNEKVREITKKHTQLEVFRS